MIRAIYPNKSRCTLSGMILPLTETLITFIMCLNVLRFNFSTGSKKKSTELFSLSRSLMKFSIAFFPSKYAFIRSSLMSVVAMIPLRPLSSKGCIKTSFNKLMICCTSFRSFSILSYLNLCANFFHSLDSQIRVAHASTKPCG